MSTAPAARVPRVLDRFLLTGTVEAVEQLTRGARRIRVTGPSLRDLQWAAGQHIRVLVGDLRAPSNWMRGLRDTLRTYTVWDYDAAGHLELCIVDHPEPGPGARWSASVHIGQRVSFTRPEGRLVVQRDAPYHLFVGEETATVAFGAMLRALPPAARVHAVLELDTPQDRLPLPRAGELTWVHRDGAAPDEGGLLLEALRSLRLPDEPGVAYIAGEARACQAVRRHLTQERGWPRRATIVKPFWTPGKRGLD
ncbi:siderophore-interacting protein [Phytohabitans houttuyneae]|uniref:Siderophore-interacting protein n=1 Tax=Phytohabitans houttuyneae TaxID=1076126 RepID=A0A6V8KJB7_9ACTN|nr:siderophore-interacting protein [Phytohabitans houttuyneae]GFJ83520.1 siderophore-interacting protein [Phytohabitans houttuyneae]